MESSDGGRGRGQLKPVIHGVPVRLHHTLITLPVGGDGGGNKSV